MQAARCLILGLAAAALAAACAPETPRTSFTYGGEDRGRLDNGLRFVIMPDPSTSMIEVDVHYEVGGREDPPGKAGLAHVVEHMMFQQRPDGPESPPLMQSIGQLTTFFNAFTSADMTHYMLGGRAEMLDTFLKIEAMRMHFRCQTISEDEFLREREVVRNELRQNYGAPEAQMLFKTLPNIYPKGHAYHRMVIGTDEDLTSITLKDVCDFMDKYYVPERATVIVAGGVDVAETKKLIPKWFGPLEKRTAAPRVAVAPVAAVTPGRSEYEIDVERPYLVVAWPLPASNTPEGRAVDFALGRVFGETAFQAQEYEFAYSVSPLVLGGQLAPTFGLVVELKGLDRANEALDFVKKAAASAARGFDKIEWQQLEDYKAQASQGFLQGIESLNARTVQMGQLVQFDDTTEFMGSEFYLLKELDRIKQYDGGLVARAVKQTLDFDKAKVLVFKPRKAADPAAHVNKLVFKSRTHERREVPDVDPREAKVPLKVAADFRTLDGAKRYTLANGMRVVLLPVDSPLPLVSARLVFDVGEIHSGSTPGLGAQAARMLRPPLDMEALGRTGVSVAGNAGEEQTTFYSAGLDLYLEVILRGLERTVRAGDYSQRGVENWQKRVRESFGRKDYQQETEFDRQLLTALYGADHPYTRNGVLTPDAADKMGRDKLDGFRREHYSAGNATLIVVGKFDITKAEGLIEKAYGGWGKGHVDEPIGPEGRDRTAPEFIGVVGNQLPSMQVRIAYPAPAGIDGQEAARMVMAGMMNLRVGDLRFKKGLTYGVYAFRAPKIGPTAYLVGGNVDASRAGEALAAMRDGIDMLRRGDHFDIDFVRARRELIENLLAESTVSDSLAGRLATIARFRLQPDYYKQLIKQIAAVSPAQVRMLIKNELDPDHEIVVCLADRPTLEKAFTEAGLEQVKIVEPDYR